MSDVDFAGFEQNPATVKLLQDLNKRTDNGWTEVASTRYIRRWKARTTTKRIKAAKPSGNGFA